MEVKENISMLSDLKLKLPKTKEDLENIERILRNPHLLKIVEENPDLKRLIANFVLKLKNEWDHKNKRRRKLHERKDINWLCRYISSFKCMGILGESVVHTNKNKAKKEKAVANIPKQEETNILPIGVSRKEIIPALAQALLVAKELKESGQRNVPIKGVKVHLDSKKLTGRNFLTPNLYQGVAEMLIKKLNQNYQETSLLQLKKRRVIHNLDFNDCTNRKFICATFSPINTVSTIIIIKPMESKESPYYSNSLNNFARNVVCSSTQTEENVRTNYCDCYSLDSQLSITTNPSRYEKVVEVCKRMASPSFHCYDISRDASRRRTTQDSSTSDCVYYCTSAESVSEYNEETFSCGEWSLSSVFKHYQQASTQAPRVCPETVIEESREISCATYSESFESNEMMLNNEECYEINNTCNSFPAHRSIMVGEDTDTSVNFQSDVEGQMPPEISTGFSDISYKNGQCYSNSEDGSVGSFNKTNYDILDCCSSFFVNENGEIIPSNREHKDEIDQVQDNYNDNQIISALETIAENHTETFSSGDECLPILKENRMSPCYQISKECPEFGLMAIQRPVRKTLSEIQLTKRLCSTDQGAPEENVQEINNEDRPDDEAYSEASSLGKETVMELEHKAQHDEGKRKQKNVKLIHQEVKMPQECGSGRNDSGRSFKKGNLGRTQRKFHTVNTSSSETLVRPPPPWKVRREAKRQSKHKHKGCVIS